MMGMQINRFTRLAGMSGRALAAISLAAAVGGCSSLGASGPSSKAISRAGQQSLANADIKVVELTDTAARQVMASSRAVLFSEMLGDGVSVGTVIGRGDVVDIAIWEAPPAALFGSVGGEARNSMATTTSRSTSLPEQMVDSTGRITVPFAGAVPAAGRTTQQIERDIVARLSGKAHLPQAIVRLMRNAAANVTVVGDVTTSARVPLTAKGERLLDVLASAGGVKQPVGKTMIQITRGTRVAALPLELVIRDPQQNIRLQADDIVTALFQPYSFTALGAIGNNAELPFEGTGLTLAQALGRVGGLQDSRADIRGVFIFRLEDPAALDPALVAGARTTPDGKIPVIYRLDLRNPASFFVAQGFPIRNKDVLYVSNAPVSDLQKFVSIVSSMAFSVIGIGRAF